MIEDKVYKLVISKVKSNCRKLLHDEALYIQPENDEDIDLVLRSCIQDTLLFQENDLDLEYEVGSIDDLFPELRKKALIEKSEVGKEMQSTLQNIAEENKIDSKTLSALKLTSLKPRVEPPDEFFMLYIDLFTSLPIFLGYLLMIVLMKTWSALFEAV